VPTPEAGALLSGLITVPTSTRGICVRAYTLRGERERERERERGKKEREREREGGVGSDTRGRRGRCNIARRGLFMRARTYTHGRPRYDVHTGARGAPYQHAKLDFMCDRMPSRRDSYANRNRVTCTRVTRENAAAKSRRAIDVFSNAYCEILTTSILHCVISR